MLIVDVETSGLDPQRHALLSIGAVDFLHPERTFYKECRLREGAQADAASLAVNGFTPEQITDVSRESEESVVRAFLLWVRVSENHILGGHNTFFDRDFLRNAFDRYNLSWPFGYHIVDLHSVCYATMVRSGIEIPLNGQRSHLSSSTVFQFVGLPKEPRPHNGLVGAKYEAEAFSRLLHGKNLLQEFAQYELPHSLATEHRPQSALL